MNMYLDKDGRLSTPEMDFEHNGKKYRYEFNKLSIEQAELGRELGEYKALQAENPPPNFDVVVSSGGADWLIRLGSYLLREMVGDELKLFTFESHKGVMTWLKSMNLDNMQRLEAVASDFFIGIGKQSILSATLLRLETGQKMQKWLQLTQAIEAMKNAGSLPKNNTKSETPTIETKPKTRAKRG